MRKVLHVIGPDAPAGAIGQLALLAGAEDAGVSIGPAPPGAEALGMPVRATHRPMGSARLAAVRLRGRAEAFDLLHAWSPDALLAGRELALATARPLVASLPTAPAGRRLAAVAEAVGPGLLHLTAPTDAARAALLAAGVPAARAAVLPPAAVPPADPAAARRRVREYLGLDEPVRLLAAPAGLARRAGGDHVAWAYAIVRQVLDGLAVIFPGDGPGADAVRRFAQTTGFADEMHFTGRRFSLAEALAASDLAVFCHRRSAGAAPLAAALAAGLPVVAAATPEAVELTGAGRAALLTAPGEPREAAAAILRILEDADLAARLARAARRLARERFAPAGARQRLAGIYQAALEARAY